MKSVGPGNPPPPAAQASTLFAVLVVAVRATLAKSKADRRRGKDTLRLIAARMKANGIDVLDDNDKRVVGFEKYVADWLRMPTGKE